VSPTHQAITPVQREGRGFDYFLEVSIACEFLDHLAASCEAPAMSEMQRLRRLTDT
jgi:hypothetical protein